MTDDASVVCPATSENLVFANLAETPDQHTALDVLCLDCGWSTQTTLAEPLRVANKHLFEFSFPHAKPETLPQPGPDEPVAWRTMTRQIGKFPVHHGLPAYGHRTCIRQMPPVEWGPAVLVPFSTPDLSPYCAGCNKPLLPQNRSSRLDTVEHRIACLTSAAARHVALHHRHITDAWGIDRLSGQTYRARADKDWQKAQAALLQLQVQAATQPSLLKRTDLWEVISCAQGMNIRLSQHIYDLHHVHQAPDSALDADEPEINRLWSQIKTLDKILYQQLG